MLGTHRTADIMIHRFYTVYQKRSTEPQYGYSHLGVHEIMIQSSYMISPKKVIRTSKWVQSFRFLQGNDTQLLYGLWKKVTRTAIWVQPLRCLQQIAAQLQHGVTKRSTEPQHGYSHLVVYAITIHCFAVGTSMWTVGTLLAEIWIMCLILKKYNLLGT